MDQRTVDTGMPLNSMKLKLKKLKNQVMVITGATSGIGLVTARMAAEQGVKLVLAARNEDALNILQKELKVRGTESVYVVADVSKEEDIDKIADRAIGHFGGFDTWVNNAGVALYGYSAEIPVEDMRHLFDINFWGIVYGTRKAVAHYKEKGEPGSIINLGSVVGNRAFPVQSIYSASKHAIRGFTDGIRMELEKEHAPVVISQIHPARIDTPYTDHATSYIDKKPTHKGIVYPPESVAEAILHVAEHPTRDMYVGTQAKFFSIFGMVHPRITDKIMELNTFQTNYDENQSSPAPEAGNLFEPKEDLYERGTNLGWHRPKSLMVKAKKHPALSTIGLMTVGAALAALKVIEVKKAMEVKKVMEIKKLKKSLF
ncbi:SDR family oxidoreductase [Marinilactibacillus sp. XAAS-LB27]|uniref:SDR family oxidoreductase n=1 Tax=Marinilactibacillus sp. XAAS-LB27 TaxID=3114538 RepID=UPI002E19F263|nr:SDR family oxidoreductase [Marinilactibacillus sp. XAAS-LB27]